jgi:hypothetical protein
MGREIYGTEFKVNLLPNTRTIGTHYFFGLATSHWPGSMFELAPPPPSPTNARPTVLYHHGQPYAAWLYEIHDELQNDHRQVIQAFDGPAFESNLLRYRRGGPRDTTVWVSVFNPDPLSTARTMYGGAYVNNNDRDTQALGQERQFLPVSMKYLSDSIWAENKYLKLVTEETDQHIPWGRNDTFDVSRSHPWFEHLMALYHLSQFRAHIRSLGFTQLMDYQITVRPRAFVSDNSNFSRLFDADGKGRLNYGYSVDKIPHVDDAEDADVLIHEYGHATSYHANLNDADGAGRKALDEGLCDYLAASYSHSLSDYRSDYVYSWDGHNEFWEGRACNTSKTVLDYNASKTYHENGEIFSSALYDIMLQIGRRATDAALLGSLYSYADRMPFSDGALLFLETASLILRESEVHAACSIFAEYGFVPQDYCNNSIFEGPIQVPYSIDHTAFAQHGIVQIAFGQSFTGTIQLVALSGQVLMTEKLEGALSFSSTAHVAAGPYALVISNYQIRHTAKLIR